jgi:hypothetical protein
MKCSCAVKYCVGHLAGYGPPEQERKYAAVITKDNEKISQNKCVIIEAKYIST